MTAAKQTTRTRENVRRRGADCRDASACWWLAGAPFMGSLSAHVRGADELLDVADHVAHGHERRDVVVGDEDLEPLL